MSRIRKDEVERVARLAYLNLSEEEQDRFVGQLNDILEAATQLQELNTDDVPPMRHAVPLQNVLRPDENRPSLPRERTLANAPQEQDGFFRVPRIVEES